jgi:hypothetical protein
MQDGDCIRSLAGGRRIRASSLGWDGLEIKDMLRRASLAAALAVTVGGCGFSALPQMQPGEPARSTSLPLQVIVVRSPEEASQILARLKNGEDFAAVAREKSIDPTANAGGSMGKLAPQVLLPALRDALRGLAPGQPSPVAHIPEGYAILEIVPAGATATAPPNPATRLALAAAGGVHQDLNVGGLGEAESALMRFPKTEGWNLDPQRTCAARQGSLSGAIGYLTALLAPGNSNALAGRDPMDVLQLHYFLAQLYAYQGEMDPAIEQFEAAYRIAQSQVPGEIPQLQETLGIAYLHKSEIDNNVYRDPGNRCLLPLRPGHAYQKPESSRKSVAYLRQYLQQRPDALDAQWLLNLAYMTLGEYPAGVPRKYLVPPSTFTSRENVGRFRDVARETGLNLFSMAGGLIVDDFENNGRLDVATSSMGNCDAMHYFHNNGDGTFSDGTVKAGISGELGGLNMVSTDYNNDGCTDILVLRGGWEFPQRMSLLRNDCHGSFTDVTAESGLANLPVATQTAVWADINNDGLLDLFVGNENGPSQLYLNKGDGTFQNISRSAGVDKIAFTKAVTAADYDQDGYVDFYVSNLGANFLYHNNHDNTFTEVAAQAGVADPGQSFAAWFFDYDNDGLPDLFVTSYYTSVEETMRSYLGRANNAPTMKLYKNLGNGKFQDVTAHTGLDKVWMPMGGNFGDIDNDGFLDIYLGTGDPSYASLVPNILLRNHDGKYFADVTTSSGTGELHKGHGVAFADMDNTGQEDLLEVVGGAEPGDSHAFRFFRNPGNQNDWIAVKLVGVKSNRAAIGAEIHVTVRDAGQPSRSIYRWVGSGGSFGASPLQQHIGLGKSATVEKLEVWWPASRTRQTFTNVGKDQTIRIKEFDSGYTLLKRPQHRAKAGAVAAAAKSAAAKASGTKP